jgi:hypothetical protein
MSGPIVATHAISSERLAELGGMVPKGLGGDRVCVGDRAHDGVATWHRGGGGG